MNILFHMHLSGDNPELLVGNFMGDFVKGPLGDDYHKHIRQGLVLHRKIDSFSQKDINFQTSRLRLSPHIRFYRGVLVDLFYDHFLAKQWDSRSDTPFPEYLSWARNIIEGYMAIMPTQLQEFVPIIFNELLPSYKSIAGTEAALKRMSRRARQPNPLAEGGAELTRHYEGLETDFERFIIVAQDFSTNFIKNGGSI